MDPLLLDSSTRQRLNILLSAAQQDPSYEGAFLEEYMAAMKPPTPYERMMEQMMNQMNGGGASQTQQTEQAQPSFSDIYGTDPKNYTQQSIQDYKNKFGNSPGEITEVTNPDGLTAKVFVDNNGLVTVIDQQEQAKQNKGGMNWMSAVPGLGSVLGAGAETAAMGMGLANAAFDKDKSVREAYREFLESPSRNPMQNLSRSVIGDTRYNRMLDSLYDPKANSTVKTDHAGAGQQYADYLGNMNPIDRYDFLQNPNDSWRQ